MLAISNWMDIGNGERSAVVQDPEQPGNYKSCRVRPWPSGEFFAYVNGELRARRRTRTAAQKAAINFAVEQLTT